ncbi:TRAP transporter small permease [Glaciecola sp. KUL10]|uniref:TRAP transporter small permease n=1 Tax=Glaciecola sp. (strain KUL10) TaxID=2161813 RepID=UPI000D91D0C7|nr:TRAP transporter small permease [Glaciecola sp. KUL10]GBL05967.1 hypothetical protein KUL10_33000 [Glaciecola sp. KUL10]
MNNLAQTENYLSQKVRRMLDNLLEPALVIIISVLVVAVLWQVFSRYVLQAPSTVTDELARFLLIWLTLLGAAWVVGQKGHLAIDLLSDQLSPPKAIFLSRLLLLLMAIFAIGVLIIGGLNLVQITLTLEQTSTVLQLPMGYIYLALPVSGIFIVAYCVCLALAPMDEQTQKEIQ